jgi:Polyketide cyclase / dehydrase and lipid transport
MFKQTLELTLDVRPAEVFRHIALEFFDNHPRWDPDIVELTKTSEGAVGLGTTGREVRDVRGRRFVTDFRITVFRPDEAFSHRSQGGAMGEDVDYAIEGHPPGSILRMTVHIYPRSLLMRILAPLIRPQVQRNFTANVGRFEQMLRALPASK